MPRFILILVLLAPMLTRAERGELYTLLEGAPSIVSTADALDGTNSQARAALGGRLVAYYGLTHELHLGGALHGFYRPDIRFADKQLTLTDGSTPNGDLWENVGQFGAAAVLAYRFDTGHLWAPVLRAEVGASLHRYTSLQFFASAGSFSQTEKNRSEFRPDARLVGSLEYRFWDRFIASAGLGVQRSFGALTGWRFDLPLSLGAIW